MLKATRQRQACAALFMDVKNAFPSMAHVMVFGEQNLERRIAKVDCLVQELPEQYRARERDFILEWLDGGSALQRLGVLAQLAARLKDWHTRSFVAVEGDSRVAPCAKGTRRGDPLADIIFDVATHAALDMFVKERLINPTTPLPLSLTTVRGGSCRRWTPRWLRCARPWHDSACISILAQKKTELMLMLRGKGTQEARRSLLHDQGLRASFSMMEPCCAPVKITGTWE